MLPLPLELYFLAIREYIESHMYPNIPFFIENDGLHVVNLLSHIFEKNPQETLELSWESTGSTEIPNFPLGYILVAYEKTGENLETTVWLFATKQSIIETLSYNDNDD